jgi:hypothetical protein
MRIFGSERDEVVEGWIGLYNEEFHDFYDSRSITRVMKLRRMRWAVHAACIGEMRKT